MWQEKFTREETEDEKIKRLAMELAQDQLAHEKKKNSPFQHFLQVNADNYNAEDWLMRKSPAAYRILRFLVQNMDNYNALVCSYKVMHERLGYSKQTISNALKLLKENKYLEISKSGTANIYHINKELYWKSYGTNYAYAEFGAKIILTSTEQDKETRHKIEVKRRNELILSGSESNSSADGESPAA